MSLAETRSEYDDADARKVLKKSIKVYQAKAAELADMRAAIEQAEAKLAAQQETIDKSAHVEDAVAEAAAEAPAVWERSFRALRCLAGEAATRPADRRA